MPRDEVKTRITAVIVAVHHSADRYATWNDVIAQAIKCRDSGQPLTIKRRKKTKKMRIRNRELARLIGSQKADERDRSMRFENAINN